MSGRSGAIGGRVLVTGGGGLIGRALVAELAAAGAEPVVLSRSPESVRGLPPGARAAAWDGVSAAGWGEFADGAAAIVHLAGENIGEGRWTAARKRRLRDSRLRSGQAIVEAVAAARTPPRVLVQASGVDCYAPHPERELDEGAALGAGFLAELARQWEDSTAAVEARGVRRVVARTAMVLGRRGGALPKMLPPFRLGLGGPLGGGRQFWPWIHLADEVGALRFLLETETASGPFNLTAPRPVRNREFGAALGRALRRPAVLPVPAFALRLLLGEMATVVLESHRAVPRRLLAAGYRFRFPEVEGALRDLLA
jgi:uncharacterized protein (TIGR01777 family)